MTNIDPQQKDGGSSLTGKQRAFLAAFRIECTIKHAADACDQDRGNHYRWMKSSESYREAFALAEQDVADELEREARRRAIEGVTEPIMYRGKQVHAVQRYSDLLLIFLLKGARPHKYRDYHQEPQESKPKPSEAPFFNLPQQPDSEAENGDSGK